VYTICVLARRISLRPIPQWVALEGCTAVALTAEHDDARQARRHCARACGALTRVRRACLWRAQRAVPTSTDPRGNLKSTQEFKAAGAGKEHTSAVRGGGRDPGVRRPGSGLGQPTARSKFFLAACIVTVTHEWVAFCDRNSSHWISEKGPGRGWGLSEEIIFVSENLNHKPSI